MIADALYFLRPGAEYCVDGDTYEGITWLSPDIPMPTKDEVLQAEVYVQAQTAQNSYIDARAKNYPSIGDQLDDLFRAGAFSEEMKARIQSVKDRFPKPETAFKV